MAWGISILPRLPTFPAYTPFLPRTSYHQGLGRQFAIALESANVVAAVMADAT